MKLPMLLCHGANAYTVTPLRYVFEAAYTTADLSKQKRHDCSDTALAEGPNRDSSKSVGMGPCMLFLSCEHILHIVL